MCRSGTACPRVTRFFAVILLALGGFTLARPIHAADRTETPIPPGMELTRPEVSSEIPGTLHTINAQLSAGLKPQENTAIWLAWIYGDDAFEVNLRDGTLEMLGIKTMPSTAPLFVSAEQYSASLADVPRKEIPAHTGRIQEQLLLNGAKLWTAENSPELAGYLKANEKSLEALHRAAECPRYFAPLLAPEIPSRLISASLVIERRLPFLVRLLSARALLRVAEADVKGAIQDLVTCHRLAALLATGSPFDVSVSKAQVMDSTACEAERAILSQAGLNQEQLSEFLDAMTGLPPFPANWKAADIGERAIIHQEIELLQSDEESQIGFFEDAEHEDGNPAQIKSLARCDWKLANAEADAVQDRIVKALQIQDRQQQLKQLVQLEEQYQEWEKTVDAKTSKFAADIQQDVPGVSRWVGENMAMSMRTNAYQRRAADDRMRTRRGLVLVGAALEVYQRAEGAFPETLAALIPKYLKQIPNDACTDAPFGYTRQSADRARLISWGTNRIDDAGQNYNDDTEIILK